MVKEVVSSDELGPAMLALDERQRKFVFNWLGNVGRDGAKAAREAGYSDEKDGAKVRAHRLLRSPRIIAALKEEADRDVGLLRVIAQMKLKQQVMAKKPKLAVIDSALDRTGFGRQTTQDIRVEHVDNRSTAEILAEVRRLMPKAEIPAIEGAFTEVKDGD